MSRFGQTLKSVALTIGRAVPLVGGLVVLALLVAWISGMFNTRIPPGEESHAARTLGERRVEQVNEVNKEYIEEAVGTLKAASRSVISARVLATIDEIHVVAGDRVDAGDLLVSLNQEEFKTQLSQAQQSLASAEAAAVEAQNDFQRLERLLALISGLAVFSLMVLAVISVGGRNAANMPLPGYVDWIEQAMPLIAFLGISYVQRDGGHIRMDILISRLHGRALWFFELVSVLLILLLMLALAP